MIGFPFDSLVTYDQQGNPSYDRAISSKPLKTLISKLFTTGFMPLESDNLQVFAGSEGMTVVVHPGFCVIEGGLKLEENNRTLTVQAADTTYDRIDTVVMRWNGNDNARVCDLYVIEGTPAATPVRPTLTRTGSIYEIGLADLYIPSNSSVISQERITDTRYESARCGVVSSVSEWDTTTIYTQVQADLADFKAEEQADFVVWYNSVKDAIDALTAAQLESEIQGLDNSKQPKTLETPITIEGQTKTTVEAALQGLVGSVADGKASVASAITDKGVTTAATDSFSTMANNISQIQTNPNLQAKSASASTSQQEITPDSGYDGLSKVTIAAATKQAKTVSPTTAQQVITPDSGYYGLSQVAVNAIQTQEKTCTPSTTAQNITPDSGKYLTKVAVSAIVTQTKTSTPTTRSATAATVTPDSGKYLTKVTVNTNSVPNSNSGTCTLTASETGTKDMGATNTYRYVDATNVYNQGKADGASVLGAITEYSLLTSYNRITISNAVVGNRYIVVVFCGTSCSVNSGATTDEHIYKAATSDNLNGVHIFKLTATATTIQLYGSNVSSGISKFAHVISVTP